MTVGLALALAHLLKMNLLEGLVAYLTGYPFWARLPYLSVFTRQLRVSQNALSKSVFSNWIIMVGIVPYILGYSLAASLST